MGAGMGTASARPAHMSTAYDERVHSAASAQTRRARPWTAVRQAGQTNEQRGVRGKDNKQL